MMKNRTTMRRVGVAEEMDIVDPERINVVNSSSVIRQARRAVYVIPPSSLVHWSMSAQPGMKPGLLSSQTSTSARNSARVDTS